jgi:uncharacterized cupredoxin-like copper-binding protein
MWRNRSRSLLAALGALLILASCGGDGGSGELTGEPGDPAQVDETFDLEANNQLRFAPDAVEVEAGQTIEFVISNVADVDHEFVLGPAHEHAGMDHENMGSSEMTGTIPPGESKTVVWTFTEPGEVTFACYIAGHNEAGMTGTVKISG